jgi:hypothetical protein
MNHMTHFQTSVAARVAVLGAVATLSFTLTGCGGPKFSVGDCVKIREGVIDSKLEPTSCAGAQGTFDQSKRVYKVKSVIKGTSGSCPQLAGFFPVQFTDEPDNAIYCLAQADGSS